MENNKLVLVDICGTLYDSNTTFDFLDFYCQTSSYRLFRKITRSLPWRVVNKMLIGGLGVDLTRILAVRYLKGHTRDELDEAVERFYDQYLKPREIVPVHTLVKQFGTEGYSMMLVSATLDFIAACISRHMQIDSVVSTQLNYSEGFCRGTLDEDLLRHKRSFLISINLLPPYEATVTDNLSDDVLVKVSRRAYIVTYPKSKRKWEKKLVNHPSVVFIDALQS